MRVLRPARQKPHLFGREPHVRRRQAVAQLRQRLRADHRAGGKGLRSQPAQANLRSAQAGLLAERFQTLVAPFRFRD